MPWRAEDQTLLERLEDEALVQQLFAFYAGAAAPALHPRAGGLVAELRRLPGGASAVDAAIEGQLAPLTALVERLAPSDTPPTLLHHLALFHGAAAEHLLAAGAPHERVATAWVRALAAWVALGEERTYLDHVEGAVLGPKAGDLRIPPDRVALELVASIARHADASARELSPRGRGALAALARIDEAARLGGASPSARALLGGAAQRHRNAAVEAALAVTAEALDEASVRGADSDATRALLLRATAVWTWSNGDDAVEHFVVDRLERLGWELYRARRWLDLRALLEPFHPMIESLARRIITDPTQIAYAASGAQMFVFLAEVERDMEQKIALAERAVMLCPTHRNGRLVLAVLLCQHAQNILRTMAIFARRDDLARCEAMIARAAQLYPQATELEPARSLLAAVKKGRIAV